MVRKSSVGIFLIFGGLTGFFLMTSEPTIGLTTWEEFVVIFLVCGLVLAKVMFKEKKKEPAPNVISNIGGPPERPRPRTETPETIQMTRHEPEKTGMMDSIDIVERLLDDSVATAKKLMNDSIEAAAKLATDSATTAERYAKTDPSKWDSGELSTSGPGMSLTLRKGKIEPTEEPEQLQPEEESDLGRITELPNQGTE